MGPYFLLTNRKRAIIALVHSLAFLVLAAVLRPTPNTAMVVIYTVVTGVLVTFSLLSVARERLYFALCAMSAAVGLARVASTHPALDVAPSIRVAALAAAATVAVLIMRTHSQS